MTLSALTLRPALMDSAKTHAVSLTHPVLLMPSVHPRCTEQCASALLDGQETLMNNASNVSPYFNNRSCT